MSCFRVIYIPLIKTQSYKGHLNLQVHSAEAMDTISEKTTLRILVEHRIIKNDREIELCHLTIVYIHRSKICFRNAT